MLQQPFFNMRSVLAAGILGLCSNTPVQRWLAVQKRKLLAEPLSLFDKRMISRLWPAPRTGRSMSLTNMKGARRTRRAR